MVNISHPIWYIKVRKATISSVKKYVDINTEKSNDVDILQTKPIDTAPAVQIIPVLSDISIGVMSVRNESDFTKECFKCIK